MKLEKIKYNDFRKRMGHAYRLKKTIEHVLNEGIYKGKSKIDPTKTDLNQFLGGDVEAQFKEDYENTYHKKDSVVAFEGVITYPVNNPPRDYQGNVIEAPEFFVFVNDALYNSPYFNKHFKYYGGAIHYDETNMHYHFFVAPIEKLDKPITKVVGIEKVEKTIKSTGKTKTIERRIKKQYNQQYNAKKLMNREFFNECHYKMEEALNDMGVMVELITPEVRAFNKFKANLKQEYKEKIEKADTVEVKTQLLHEMFEILQGKDPKKTHKSIQQMYAEEFDKQKAEIEAQEQAKLESVITEYEEQKNSVITEYNSVITELKEKSKKEYAEQKAELQKGIKQRLQKYVKNELKKGYEAIDAQIDEEFKGYREQQEREILELDEVIKQQNEQIEINKQRLQDLKENLNKLDASFYDPSVNLDEIINLVK